MRCGRKLSFDTVEQAERTAEIVHQQRPDSPKVPVRIYRCRKCRMLHFTSQSEDEAFRPTTVAVLGEAGDAEEDP